MGCCQQKLARYPSRCRLVPGNNRFFFGRLLMHPPCCAGPKSKDRCVTTGKKWLKTFGRFAAHPDTLGSGLCNFQLGANSCWARAPPREPDDCELKSQRVGGNMKLRLGLISISAMTTLPSSFGEGSHHGVGWHCPQLRRAYGHASNLIFSLRHLRQPLPLWLSPRAACTRAGFLGQRGFASRLEVVVDVFPLFSGRKQAVDGNAKPRVANEAERLLLQRGCALATVLGS